MPSTGSGAGQALGDCSFAALLWCSVSCSPVHCWTPSVSNFSFNKGHPQGVLSKRCEGTGCGVSRQLTLSVPGPQTQLPPTSLTSLFSPSLRADTRASWSEAYRGYQASVLPPILPTPLSPCARDGRFGDLWAHRRIRSVCCRFGTSFPFSACWRFSILEVRASQAGPAWGKGRGRPRGAGARGESCPHLHFALRKGLSGFLNFLLSWK